MNSMINTIFIFSLFQKNFKVIIKLRKQDTEHSWSMVYGL